MGTDCNKTHRVEGGGVGGACGKVTVTVTALYAIHLLHLHSRISVFSAVAAFDVLVSSQHPFILKMGDF